MNIGSIAASALNAFGVDMLVRANNIANVNTPAFQSQRVDLMSGHGDQGVTIGAIYHNTTPGPLLPSNVTVAENGRSALATGYLEGSNSDLAQEFVRMTAAQRAFEANAAVIRSHDDITGTLLDLKV